MPNWCDNQLVVEGLKDAVDEFIAKVVGVDPTHAPECSQCLRVKAEHAPNGKCLFDTGNYTVAPDVMGGKPDDAEPLSFHQTVPVPQDVLDLPYSVGGYVWRSNNWGVKWSSSDIDVVRHSDTLVVYRFQTPWGPPLLWLDSTAPQFPLLDLRLVYVEEGAGFAGEMAYAKTEQLHHKEFSGPSVEYREFVNSIWPDLVAAWGGDDEE